MNASHFGSQGLGNAVLAHYLLTRLALSKAFVKGKCVYSRIKDGTLVIDRRDVIRGGLAAAALSIAVPGLAHGKGDVPTGETEIIDLMDASAIDVSALQPGEMVVVWMNSTFVGILHRTDEQQAAAAAAVGASLVRAMRTVWPTPPTSWPNSSACTGAATSATSTPPKRPSSAPATAPPSTLQAG